MFTYHDMSKVVEKLQGLPSTMHSSHEYPGYIEVLDERGRLHVIGFDDKTWAIDTYNDASIDLVDVRPDATGDIPVPEGTTDPDTVAAAIAAYITQH